MPLSKARMRERKHNDRHNVKPMSNLNAMSTVKPSSNKLEGLRQLIKGIEDRSGLHSEDVKPVIPWYNPAINKPGDTVRVMQGKRESIVTVPLLDVDGNRYD